MGIIVNGLGVGLLSAVFISLYVQGLFNQTSPIWLIYGILAPLFSAAAMLVILLVHKRKENKEIEWWEQDTK